MGKQFGVGNCPIMERTADGISVGRCWYHLKNCVCPRHGDVSVAVIKYENTGKLTDENEMGPRVKPSEPVVPETLKEKFLRILQRRSNERQ
jgi:hypothetical protein